MLTVRQHNALVALNKALQDASDCGLFDVVVSATPSVINQFCDEMDYAERQDQYLMQQK